MANMNYHKVYMNQIHSSSLLCELAQMWKNQSLCDAVIKTGTVTTKAHRLVLVAACPMLKSMENASVGSHLEVRLASDIKQDSINTFLQYLYEGVMLLTEDNFRDIEKIARILQVDSVIKCCADFYKCLHSKSQYKYDYNDHIEFKHVRQTDMLKNSDRLSKRNSDSIQPSSPGGKRPRIHILSGLPGDMSIHGVGHKMDDRLSMAHSYMSSEPPIRPHKMGPASVSRRSNVVDVVEDSVEIVQTEKDPGGSKAQSVDANSALSISVASQIQSDTNIQVINVSNSGNSTTTTTTSSASSSDPKSSSSQDISSSKVPTRPQLAGPFTSDKPPDSVPLTSTPLQGSKSFAAGSAKQAAAATAFYSASTPSSSSPTGQGGGGQEISKELSSTSTPEIQKLNSVDTSPDLSLVKKEPVGLDMQVDMQHEHGEEATSDVEFEEPPQEGSMTLDQAALSWYQGQAFKGFGYPVEERYTGITKQICFQERNENIRKSTSQGMRLPEFDAYFETDLSQHKLVRMTGNARKCIYCQYHKIRTNKGWRIATRYKCEQCNIPLCKREGTCFDWYHNYVQTYMTNAIKHEQFNPINT